MEFPSERYSVIYADPPWTYRDKARAGKRGVEFKYSTMTLDEIKALPVNEIAADDSILFLWVTWPLLVEGLDTLRAWGFKYKTVGFVWIKLNKKFHDIFLKWLKLAFGSESRFLDLLEKLTFFGMGNWTHANSEICLMGVKGKPKRIDKSVRSVILSPIREHSQKPDEARERIEKLMGDVRRVELFARTRTPGWSVWGNDVDKFTTQTEENVK